jgi:hypothetical protein
MQNIKPQIFTTKEDVPSGAILVDGLQGSISELFFIEHPHFKKQMPEAQEALKEYLENTDIPGVWIYYPYRNIAIHTLPEDLYFKLRTARNKNIILEEEQQKYRQAKVGVAGLSVGSAIVSALTISGGPKVMKIADFDTVEVSNLNRIKASLPDLGQNKAEIAARSLWELDPFAELEIWDKGVSKETVLDFVSGLDIFIDEMDSIDVKLLSRLVAKEKRIPVLMATDNGDSIILDVERFDLEPEREIFHGLVGHFDQEAISNLDFKQWLKLATQIVGPEYLTERMQDTLLEMGKSVPSVPQLGTTANIAGSAMAFVVRRIANKQAMPSGRYVLGCESAFVPGYNDPEQVQLREQKTKDFLANFGKR